MFAKTVLKTAFAAAVVLLGSAGAFAGEKAWADGHAPVFNKYWEHVDTLWDGQKVWVDWCKKGYCRIEYDGYGAFVKKHDLNFKKHSYKKQHHYEQQYSYKKHTTTKVCISDGYESYCVYQ